MVPDFDEESPENQVNTKYDRTDMFGIKVNKFK